METARNKLVLDCLAGAKKPAPARPWALKLAGPDFIADEDEADRWLIDFYPGCFIYSANRHGWVLRSEPSGHTTSYGQTAAPASAIPPSNVIDCKDALLKARALRPSLRSNSTHADGRSGTARPSPSLAQP
jgi:hypothetical protein